MKKLPYIRESRRFYGKFEVVASADNIIPCYNLATARSIVTIIVKEKNESKTSMGWNMDRVC